LAQNKITVINSEEIITPFTATRALEHICFYPIEFPAYDGDVYTYVWVDAYSRFLFITGSETKVTDDLILKHLKLFLQEPDFTKNFKGLPWNLFVHKREYLLPNMAGILNEFNATSLAHEMYVAKFVMPVIEFLYRQLEETARKEPKAKRKS